MSTTIQFAVGSLPDVTKMVDMGGIVDVMRDWAMETWRGAVRNRMSGGSGVNRRTGALARDWAVEAKNGANGPEVLMYTQGTANKYAGTLEHGGTVTPKNSQYLWVPILTNLTGKGVARMSPSQAIDAGGFVLKRDGKNPLFCAINGKELEPLFALVKSVTIQPKLGMGQYFQSCLPALESAISNKIRGSK